MSVNPLHQNQERDAFFEGVYQSCHKPLHLYAVGLCKQFGYDSSSADDALHEVYYKLLSKYPATAESFQMHGPGYLFRMVRNEMLGLNRKEKSLNRIYKVWGERSPREATPNCYSREEFIDWALRILEKLLSEKDLALFKLYLYGYSMKELGEELGMNPSTVGVRIHRIKQRLTSYNKDA